MSLGCCAAELPCTAVLAACRERATAQPNTTSGRRVRSFVVFVLRTFYVLAIRRCKPGPARWP